MSAPVTIGSPASGARLAGDPAPVATGGPVRDCQHLHRGHTHGTRAAYVADRCRCAACREANRRHAQARARARAYGQWQPYTDAAPVREHLQGLRRSGLGVERIIALSGLGSGTIRQLLYCDSGTGQPVTRLRTQTAEKLLALHPDHDIPAAGSLCDAASTRERLGGLLADGWSLQHLAQLLDTDSRRLRATMSRDRVRYGTARRVAGLYARLAATPQPIPSQCPQIGRAQESPARPGWTYGAPISDGTQPVDCPDRDDIDTHAEEFDDVHPNENDIDEVAVMRAIEGSPVPLTSREQLEVIDRLTKRGRSLRDIAALLHTSPRTIARRRERLRSSQPATTTASF